MMKTISIILLHVVFSTSIYAQKDSIASKLNFNADFRFRLEQDWNSKKSDGTFREDRTRLRYRLRAGVEYENNWYNIGFRLRTGNPRKQQDPQLTLGEGFKEFGTLPLGLEKAYFEGKWSTFNFWVGKNRFPFNKNNELFWSDNVYPEGVFFGKSIRINSSIIDSLDFRAGHFIISASGKLLGQDTYFQGYQLYISFFKSRFELFPALYLFKNVPNIPDGNETFDLDYTIFHVGSKLNLIKKPLINVELDYYYNIQNYSQIDSISANFKNEKSGFVIGLTVGELKQKGDWIFEATYANLQQYSALDIMAQNDWARWDYSAFGSPDGRLTNMHGIEIVSGLKISKKACLKIKYYLVEQLIPFGIANETGSRIRFDLDVKL
ncbi:MAG: putative porin [Crocinitomicaceae bacterium]